MRWLLAILLGILSVEEAAADDRCGSAPVVVDEEIRGDIEGKAKLLSSYLGNASLSGQIEAHRKDIFSKYPNADQARSNSYFQYQVCIIIMESDDLTTKEKISILTNNQIIMHENSERNNLDHKKDIVKYIKTGDVKSIANILNDGFDVNSVVFELYSDYPIHVAAKYCRISVIKTLIDYGAVRDVLNIHGKKSENIAEYKCKEKKLYDGILYKVSDFIRDYEPVFR